MRVKDYYKILELPPNAGDEEVKKNFRKLAIRFHPDTNKGKKHEDAWYREIQEAYQVLIDPAKKMKYLQDRWLLKSKGQAFEDTFPLTPDYIALRFKSMRTMVNNMDHFRMDHSALEKQLVSLCSSEIIDALDEYHDPSANRQIVHYLFTCMEPLDFAFIHSLKIPLQKIARRQADLQKEINAWFEKRKRQHWWDKKQGLIIAAITIAVCVAIALLTKL